MIQKVSNEVYLNHRDIAQLFKVGNTPVDTVFADRSNMVTLNSDESQAVLRRVTIQSSTTKIKK